MGNKTIKAKCIICGEVEVQDFWQDESFILIPTAICPTLKDVDEYYKQFDGKGYEETTGVKLEDGFEKGMVQPSHMSPDDMGFEEAKKHILEPIECWIEG